MTRSKDKTIENNYLQRFEYLVLEYEKIKRKEHPRYRYVKDLFKDYRIAHQNFSKYYHRYIQSGRRVDSLKPEKRGPKYKLRRIDISVEKEIVRLRKLGLNKFEIQNLISSSKLSTPSLTTIYNYMVKHNLNIKNKPMKEEKVRYVRKKAGELVHIDCHNLGRGVVDKDSNTYYIVSLVDDATRLAWSEVVTDIKSITVMFSVLRSINMLYNQYHFTIEEVLTDNGPEFGSKSSKNKYTHPFERLLLEFNIKHRYTRPYRPQTNGKIERFWRTLHDDLIDGTYFESLDNLKDELLQYNYYYNELRPHQGINGKTPSKQLKSIRKGVKDASK